MICQKILRKLRAVLKQKSKKETTVDKATNTETDNLHKDINKNSRNLDIHQSTCESSAGA
jgi:hypothetical protein